MAQKKEDDEHPFPFMQQAGGKGRTERNSVPSSSSNLQHLESSLLNHHMSNVSLQDLLFCRQDLQFLMPYGFPYKHQASLHDFSLLSTANATFAQVQSPTYEVGSSSSRILQDSSEVQSLASRMEALNLWNVNGFHDYETNQYHEAWLQPMNNIESANAGVPMHQHHRLLHPIGGFLGPPSREHMVWPHSHLNLEPLCGRWVSIAKDPRGSRSLQQKIDEATPQENFQILKELKYHLHELIKHPYGNFVILKLFQSSNISLAQKSNLIFMIIMDRQKLKDLCIHDLGSRVIQQILENEEVLISINQITHAMRCITVALMKNFNGGYVIQQCLKLFPPQHKNAILDVVAQHCHAIAVNRCGCCIIQKCIKHDDVPAFYDLVENLISNAEDLAKDQYGNYVLQFLVKRKILKVNAMLVLELRYKYVGLSTNKYASNVVEDLLHYSRTDDAAIIAKEIMESPDFLQVVQHQYGNYVVQRALEYTEGSLHGRLCSIILSYCDELNSCIHGKMVLHLAEKGRRVRGFGKQILKEAYMT